MAARILPELEMQARRAISEKKLLANRANAQKSTGPRTQVGKAAVRRNALKHGIRSSCVGVLPNEYMDHLNAVLSALKKSREPQTIEDAMQLEAIACLWWKLGQVVQLESDSLSRLADPSVAPVLQLIRRYEGSLVRRLRARILESARLQEVQGTKGDTGHERKELEPAG